MECLRVDLPELRQVVSALEGKKVPDERVNPYHVINIGPRSAEEHNFLETHHLAI